MSKKLVITPPEVLKIPAELAKTNYIDPSRPAGERALWRIRWLARGDENYPVRVDNRDWKIDGQVWARELLPDELLMAELEDYCARNVAIATPLYFGRMGMDPGTWRSHTLSVLTQLNDATLERQSPWNPPAQSSLAGMNISVRR